MQRKLDKKHRSELEEIKDAGLTLDWDEIARKGKISAEEVQIAKWYGIYSSRQEGNHMARVVVPGGQITAKQARALADIAENYAQGNLNLTTRQSIQMHWLKLPMLPDFLRDLSKFGLSTFHGCGDVNRNVAACPWASTCEHRRIDVLPFAKETSRVFADSRDLDNLPRKFKITYSGCGASCAQPYMNDVGAIAVVRKKADGTDEKGFKVVMGGGMGWRAFVAQEVYSFVPPSKIVAVTRAIGLLFRDHGDRFDRAQARLKFVVKRYGIDKCRELLEGILDDEGVDRSDLEYEPFADTGPEWPSRPLTEPEPVGTDGLRMQRIMIPKGELNHHQLRRIADLAEMYGDKHVYTNNRQNLEIHGVDPAKIDELQSELVKLGLALEGFFGLQDIVPCVGTTYCPLAVTKTRSLYDLLQSVVHQEKYAEIRDKVLINITGCPNSCSPYRITDIGFRGMRIREADRGSSESYEMRLGGTQESHGKVIGNFKLHDCVLVTAKVLDVFLEEREGDESLAQNAQRKGVLKYKRAVQGMQIKYETAPTLLENSLIQGHGKTDLDRKVLAKDIPCQNACPAHTNVPQYIQKIAEGDHDEAYRINQEDNVFPGVLGRVCTKPCEDACRYNWTNTHEPVHICHLKRSAADRKTGQAQPLDHWFDDTNYKIAVVGGGPAGLTVARNLRRYGHKVTVFEGDKKPGGMMRQGIPVFRLPRHIVEDEINAIVEQDIEIRTDQWCDAAKVAELLDEYDRVVVAIGTMRPWSLDLEGAPEEGTIAGLTFMQRYNEDKPFALDGDVVVIGGGFTAVDCVRSARRILGDKHRVSMLYRRSEEHMSASKHELEQIHEENIDVGTLLTPVRAVVDDKGKMTGVIVRRNLLDPNSKPGEKPRIIPVEGSEYEVPCRTLIYAIGQDKMLEVLPEGVEITGKHTTSNARLYVAGDFAYGSQDVITAVAHGKEVAEVIDQDLMSEKRRARDVYIKLAKDQALGTARVRDMDLVFPPRMATTPIFDRFNNDEVDLGFTDEQTQVHADRCYLCDYKYEINQDKCIHCDWCIKVMPRNCIHHVSFIFHKEDGMVKDYVDTVKPKDATYIYIDSDECIRCGKCLRVCPTKAINLRRTRLDEYTPVEFVSSKPAAAQPTKD